MVEWTCVFAALTLWVANILKIIYYATRHHQNHGSFPWATYTELEPAFLQENWVNRIDREQLFLASGIMNALGWMMLSYPVIQMAWVLSKGGTRNVSLNVVIAMFAVAGGLTELMTNFFWIGVNIKAVQLVELFEADPNSANWIRNDVNDQAEIGWRVLEVNHIVMRGFVTYADNFEWICLAGMFIFTFVSVRSWIAEDKTSFGSRWNTLGLFIGLVCILEFAAEILRFEEMLRSSSKIFAVVSIVYAVINRIIFIPAWIISLGFMLPRATMMSTAESRGASNGVVHSDLQLTEIQPDQADQHENFSIGDK